MEDRRKHYVTEEDISTLFQRYNAATLLALLQEVARCEKAKINWNELVKGSSTGITCPREYQMLWRHLAYQDALLEKSEHGFEPLDDDSDLDYELEALPPVSGEAFADVAASVKVLIASGLTSDGTCPRKLNVEAPLTGNIPNGQPSTASSEYSRPPYLNQGMNGTAPPTSNQKRSLPAVKLDEGLDADTNMPHKKKRKQWSAAEDSKLIAAVRKCGEGNWATILKANFKGDRTASQLAQRWATIRKRPGNSNLGNSTFTNRNQLSEAQLAARHAVSVALGNIPRSTLGKQIQNQIRPTSEASKSTVPVASSVLPVNSSTTISAKTSPKEDIINNHDDMVIKAAAMAAGGRIATPDDAAALLIKAAQAKNAVHITPRSNSLKAASVTVSTMIKSAHLTSTGTSPSAQSGCPASTCTTSHKAPEKDVIVMPTVQSSSTDATTSSKEVVSKTGREEVAIESCEILQEQLSGEHVPTTSEDEGKEPMHEDTAPPCVNIDTSTSKELSTTVGDERPSLGKECSGGERVDEVVSLDKSEKENLKDREIDSH